MGIYCKGCLSLFLIIGIVLMCCVIVVCVVVFDEFEGFVGCVLMVLLEVQVNDFKEKLKGIDFVFFVQFVEEEVVRKYFKCECKWFFVEENGFLVILEILCVDIVFIV